MKSIALLISLLPLPSLAVTEVISLPLFNGSDLSGWTGKGYAVEDAAIVSGAEAGVIRTRGLFANYIFDFEFKLPKDGTGGVGVHYPGSGDIAYTGVEIPVRGSTADADAKPDRIHGSLFALAAAKKVTLKPAGEWNSERITVNGDQIQVTVNGEVVTDARLDELNVKFPDHEGAKRRAGHIALSGGGEPVAYRNLRIAEFPPPANEEGARKAGFARIFDGKTLEGWEPAEQDASIRWIPFNGILKPRDKSKDLQSEEEYGDFMLAFDWRWSAPGPVAKFPVTGPDGKETGEQVEVQDLNSGVVIRGSEKGVVTLWNRPQGSGAVDGSAATPLAKADNPVGEWNRTLITLQGDRLTVTLNGQVVVADAQLSGIPAKGKIALKHGGSRIDFANLWIKEL